MNTRKKLFLGLFFLLSCPGLSLAEAGKLTGIWRGGYEYPGGAGPGPVRFQMVLIQDGATVVGLMKEPNSFGERKEPWLHAIFRGRFAEQTGQLTFTKTYDRTAGPSHDVEYTGTLAGDGTKVEGAWAIGEAGGGTFKIEKVAKTHSGRFSGVWSGTYHYPQNSGLKRVNFHVIMVHDGTRLVGFIKEPNTFAEQVEPWLHAVCRGRFDEPTGKLTFTKTYDGTAGEDHEVEYNGLLSGDGTKIEGTWTIPDVHSGGFTLQKAPIDAGALDGLK